MVPVGNWTEKPKQIFRGDLLVEYPRDAEDAEGRADFQRVHLLAVSCRPTLRLFIPAECSVQSESIDLVSNAEFVDFGFVHVESSITRKRTVLLLNDTNVVAKWRLLHVGQKRVGFLECMFPVRVTFCNLMHLVSSFFHVVSLGSRFPCTSFFFAIFLSFSFSPFLSFSSDLLNCCSTTHCASNLIWKSHVTVSRTSSYFVVFAHVGLQRKNNDKLPFAYRHEITTPAKTQRVVISL